MSDEQDLLGENEKEKKRLEELNKKRTRRILDVKHVLSSAEGRRYLWDLMAKAGIFRSSFDPSNAAQNSFNQGYQNMGYVVFEDINAVGPNVFSQMQREYISDLRSQKNENKNGGN